MTTNKIIHGDCLDVMADMPECSVDTIITDPPYGLNFMSKNWDMQVPGPEYWQAALRVAKPGAIMMAFGGTRTFHRLACAIEDAGWQIRDTMMWVYSQGFPKSHDISKAIDRSINKQSELLGAIKTRLISAFAESGKSKKQIDLECGFRASNYLAVYSDKNAPDPWTNTLPSMVKWSIISSVISCNDDDLSDMLGKYNTEFERDVIGTRMVNRGCAFTSEGPDELDITAPATEAAKQWDGWGTSLKPAVEYIICAQKPLTLQQICDNVALNIGESLCQSQLFASVVGKNLMSSPQELGADGLGSALWSAVQRCNSPADLQGLTDMLQSESEINSSLSIALSWLNTLAVTSKAQRMFTTEMESGLITDLKILNSLQFKNIVDCITQDEISQHGTGSSVSLAASIFNGVSAKLGCTLSHSAPGIVTSKANEPGCAPDWTPIIVAMKPIDGTFANNALEHGVAGFNIDGGRIAGEPWKAHDATGLAETKYFTDGDAKVIHKEPHPLGGWPSNVLLDEKAATILDYVNDNRPARFFYAAKASTAERNAGCDGLTGINVNDGRKTTIDNAYQRGDTIRRNTHPTVKPLNLMRYLCRLTKTPTGGIVLDPFAGSGSTCIAAMLEGREYIGIELDEKHVDICNARLRHWNNEKGMF